MKTPETKSGSAARKARFPDRQAARTAREQSIPKTAARGTRRSDRPIRAAHAAPAMVPIEAARFPSATGRGDSSIFCWRKSEKKYSDPTSNRETATCCSAVVAASLRPVQPFAVGGAPADNAGGPCRPSSATAAAASVTSPTHASNRKKARHPPGAMPAKKPPITGPAMSPTAAPISPQTRIAMRRA
jgi:hypothetical protein